MTPPRFIRHPLTLLGTFRPAFFSEKEWLLHVLAMPLTLPVGAYYFMGWRYFRDPVTFLTGTIVNVAIYWLTIVLFTLAVRGSIRRFPNVRQAAPRALIMLLSVGAIMALMAVFSVWLFSITPGTGVRFSWQAVVPIWMLGSVLAPVFCLVVGMFYIHGQWHENRTETEQLKRMALQHQFDALKGQLNPHFLFNSLNALSSLIGEDPVLAERFVDELAKVYRYLLQAGNRELVTMEDELNFITTYAHLLQTRYGNSLSIEQRIADEWTARSLPPLTVQTLIDNAMKHNVMLPDRPLQIRIDTTDDGRLRVRNNLQRKTIRVETNRVGLADIVAKYRLLGDEEPLIYETDTYFDVIVPLLEVRSSADPAGVAVG